MRTHFERYRRATRNPDDASITSIGLFSETYGKTKRLLTSRFALSPFEIPVMFAFIDPDNLTLVTTDNMHSLIAGMPHSISAFEFDWSKCGYRGESPLLKVEANVMPLRIADKNDVRFAILLRTGPGFFTFYNVLKSFQPLPADRKNAEPANGA